MTRSDRLVKSDLPAATSVIKGAWRAMQEWGGFVWDRVHEMDPSPVKTQQFGGAGRGGQRTEFFAPGAHGDHEVPEGDESTWSVVVEADPTGDAAIRDAAPLPSSEFIRRVLEVEKACAALHDYISEHRRISVDLKPDDPRGWCPVCRAAGETEPSSYRKDKNGLQHLRDADGRCRPCLDFRAEHGCDRPALLIKRARDGRKKLTNQEITDAINRAKRAQEIEDRKAAARIDTHRARARDATVETCPAAITRKAVEISCELVVDAHGRHTGTHLAKHGDEVIRWPNHNPATAAS